MEIDLKNDQCVVQIGEMDRLPFCRQYSAMLPLKLAKRRTCSAHSSSVGSSVEFSTLVSLVIGAGV